MQAMIFLMGVIGPSARIPGTMATEGFKSLDLGKNRIKIKTFVKFMRGDRMSRIMEDRSNAPANRSTGYGSSRFLRSGICIIITRYAWMPGRRMYNSYPVHASKSWPQPATSDDEQIITIIFQHVKPKSP
jgi:hypothetical protein